MAVVLFPYPQHSLWSAPKGHKISAWGIAPGRRYKMGIVPDVRERKILAQLSLVPPMVTGRRTPHVDSPSVYPARAGF
jgi:hypothetical protein